jgi:3-oxoacyl-[acyl-carrier protein] reductase
VSREKQTALVTGCSGDLGRAICRQLANDGIKVIGLSCRNPQLDCISWHQCDLANPAQIQQTFTQLDANIGILINNAAINRPSLAVATTLANWHDTLTANLNAALICTQQIVRQMMTRKSGVILNISSLAAHRPLPGQAAYAAGKAALESLTRSLAIELAPKNIRANALAPGFIRSRMLNLLPAEKQQSLLKKIPLNRFAAPEEIAIGAAFLVSPKSAYITSQTFHLDGGLST